MVNTATLTLKRFKTLHTFTNSLTRMEEFRFQCRLADVRSRAATSSAPGVAWN